MQTPAMLVTEDGTMFLGHSIGVAGSTTGEVVFNTSMTGYQEILTDPSYCHQLITFTHTHIGNVGINHADNEARQVWAKGLIVKALNPASNWRSEQSLSAWLQEKGMIGIAGIDTRALTRHLREKGAMRACLMAGDHVNYDKALAEARGAQSLEGLDLAQKVTCKTAYEFTEHSWFYQPPKKARVKLPPATHLVVMDFGVKDSILRLLVDRGARVTVVPAKTTCEDILKLHPDAVVFSNGPGDPAPCDYAIKTIQQLLQTELPLLGICLGHQLLALASGAKTHKMKFGHHGGNHPVQDCRSQQVYITSQNHGFAVDESSLPKDLLVTHRSLFDQTIQGLMHKEKPVMSFQGHPEAGPGPHDMSVLFDEFMSLVWKRK